MSGSLKKRYRILKIFLLILVALIPASCTSANRTADLGRLYGKAARNHGPDRNPVIVIPGILGSKLIDRSDSRIVWGSFAGGYADPRTPAGVRAFALPMETGVALHAIHDGIVPGGVLDRMTVSVLGLPIELKAYAEILSVLGVGGYRDQTLGEAGVVDYGADHFTCFQFDYDWRRDNVENAARLHEFILEKRAYVREELRKRTGIDKDDIRFDVVAHSMGGLLLEYYLRYGAADLPSDGSLPNLTWAGAEYVERAVLVAPPLAGSVGAFMELMEGTKLGGGLPPYPPAITGTFPSAYQLLPRSRHRAVVDQFLRPFQDILDPELWESRGWGLASPAQEKVISWLLPNVTDPAERRRIALDHQRKCLERARQFTTALDRPARTPEGLSLMLVAGDAIPTPEKVTVDSSSRLTVVGTDPGDGIVLRSSALMDERRGTARGNSIVSPVDWTNVVFLFDDHLGLTKNVAFSDNVLYWLIEAPRKRP